MEFRSILSADSKDFVSNSGTKYLYEYEYETNKAGVTRLVKTDRRTCVFDKIQADYPSTDINLLMQKFALGDLSAINVRDGFYADVTKMPKTMADLFDKAQDCKEFFEQLPADFKQLFNNSYTEFFSELNSDSKSVYAKVDEYNDKFVNHDFDVDPVPPVDEKGVESE